MFFQEVSHYRSLAMLRSWLFYQHVLPRLNPETCPNDMILFHDGGPCASGDVRLSFEAPLTDGGSAVQSYNVEWDTDPGVQEIQTITT